MENGTWKLPEHIEAALQRLWQAGYEGYIVGGCVRDYFMGIKPHDYDITTSALPEETEACFSDCRVIETGIKHGTVTVLFGGEALEITTFRTEGGYADHRHPDSVDFTRSLEKDLERRDFTVNAMAYAPQVGFVDCFGGREDMKRHLIRCVGKPAERFEEDALRILRGVRFASTLGFDIEPATYAAMAEKKGQLSFVSAERIMTELTKLLCGKDVRRVLCEDTDIIGAVVPEILPMKGFDQKNPHHCYDVLEHTAVCTANIEPTPMLRWAAFLHDVGKPDCASTDEKGVGHFYGHGKTGAETAFTMLTRLRSDKKTKDGVVSLVRLHDREICPTETAVKRCMSQTGELFFDLLKLRRADVSAQHPDYADRIAEIDEIEKIALNLRKENACLSLNQLAVGGREMMQLGKHGAEIGETLRELLNAVIDGKVKNEREALLHYAEKDG